MRHALFSVLAALTLGVPLLRVDVAAQAASPRAATDSVENDALPAATVPKLAVALPKAPAVAPDGEATNLYRYDNGPLITHPTGGFGGAPASAVQTALGLAVIGFSGSLATGYRVADDFTVPAGGRHIARITFPGYQTGSTTTSTFNHVNLRIWDGPPGAGGSNIIYGDTVTNRLVATGFSGIYRAVDTALTGNTRPIMNSQAAVNTTLAAGTYWVDWQLGGTLASGPWVPPVTLLGQTGKPGANAVQSDGTTWTALIDTALQDLPFRVLGSGPFDVNGDARTDRTVFRPGSGTWYTALTGGGATATAWGVSTDVDVMADYDGDGNDDIAVFRPSTGTWYIIQSSNGAVRADRWGTSGDVPLAGDVDGDGKVDLVTWRPSTGVWHVKNSGGGGFAFPWGTSGDLPLLGDFDGDGKADLTIYRPSTGVWYISYSGGGWVVLGWGTVGDIPVIGDFDGDGKSDPTVFRPGSGQWFVNKSSGGYSSVGWGTAGDIPVSGDWDGDGLSDFTVWRDSSGVWYTQYAVGGVAGVGWGGTGDRPTGRRPGS